MRIGVGAAEFGGEVGDVRERPSFESGERIFDQQGPRQSFAVFFGDVIEGFLQTQGARGGVVRVAGDEMHGACLEPFL